jgi:hypothetical protein
VLIGPRWLKELAARGEGEDEVRYEIRVSLERGLVIVPAVLERAKLPTTTQLPATIAPLLKHQAYRLADGRLWSKSAEMLCDDLAEALEGVAPADPDLAAAQVFALARQLENDDPGERHPPRRIVQGQARTDLAAVRCSRFYSNTSRLPPEERRAEHAGNHVSPVSPLRLASA